MAATAELAAASGEVKHSWIAELLAARIALVMMSGRQKQLLVKQPILGNMITDVNASYAQEGSALALRTQSMTDYFLT
jgi:hypothetical protein